MSTVERVEEIQDALRRSTERKSKAEGSLETLETRMREDFKCDSVEELKTKRKKLETKMTKLEDRGARLLDELEEVTDWDSVS